MSDRDPICNHPQEHVGRVSSHKDLPPNGEPHASTYVCGRNECVVDAQQWVEEITGITGKFFPFPAGQVRANRFRDEAGRLR